MSVPREKSPAGADRLVSRCILCKGSELLLHGVFVTSEPEVWDLPPSEGKKFVWYAVCWQCLQSPKMVECLEMVGEYLKRAVTLPRAG